MKRLVISKVNHSLFHLKRNNVYEVEITDNIVYQLDQSVIGGNPIYNEISLEGFSNLFEIILTEDETINMIKSNITIDDSKIFKCNTLNNDIVYHIRYMKDLITLKLDIKEELNNETSSFHIKIRSNDETHQHHYSGLLTESQINDMCNFIRFICH